MVLPSPSTTVCASFTTTPSFYPHKTLALAATATTDALAVDATAVSLRVSKQGEKISTISITQSIYFPRINLLE